MYIYSIFPEMAEFQGRFLKIFLRCEIIQAHLHTDGNGRENINDIGNEEIVAGNISWGRRES